MVNGIGSVIHGVIKIVVDGGGGRVIAGVGGIKVNSGGRKISVHDARGIIAVEIIFRRSRVGWMIETVDSDVGFIFRTVSTKHMSK